MGRRGPRIRRRLGVRHDAHLHALSGAVGRSTHPHFEAISSARWVLRIEGGTGLGYPTCFLKDSGIPPIWTTPGQVWLSWQHARRQAITVRPQDACRATRQRISILCAASANITVGDPK